MSPVVVTVSIPAEAFVSQISAAEKTCASADPAVPELLPLDLYAGRWEAGIPGRSHLKRIEVADWILNGSFLRQCWSTEGAEDVSGACGITLMTFDAARRTYLSWSFLGIRSVVQKEGEWDAATRTMTWTDQLADSGESVVTTTSFPKDGTSLWSIVEKDAKGRMVREVDGKSVRRVG